jgi:hypothetical protein
MKLLTLIKGEFIMQTEVVKKLKYYHYVAAFFAGLFLANSIPHYVNGISGNQFPSPFANPPGFGNSSATINVLWEAANLFFGYVLFRLSRSRFKDGVSMLIIFAGIVCMGVILSFAFSHGVP